MKNIAVTLISLTILSATSCRRENTDSFTIKGNMEGVQKTWVQLAKLDLSNNTTIVVDSVFSEAGEFEFEGRVESPYLHSIKFGPVASLPVFIENTEIKITGRLSEIEESIVIASREDSLFRSTGIDNVFDRKKGMEIILNNPDYTFSVFVAFYQFQIFNIDIDTMALIVDLFNYPENESIYYPYLVELFETIKKVSVSEPAPDFTMKDREGEDVSLSDFRGKYLLLDFWASWCPPCRAANPGLVEVYNKFGGNDFTIVGISVDEDRERWVKAIEDDGLEWINLSNLDGWNDISDLYGVKAIPQNFLLDRDGIIVAKNIEKDALEDFLSEQL